MTSSEMPRPRVSFWSFVTCRSGAMPPHRVKVVATMESDDGGAWIRLESVLLARRNANDTPVVGRLREVRDRLSWEALAELQWQARDQWGRAERANRVVVDVVE